jgi:hypothetical protein
MTGTWMPDRTLARGMTIIRFHYATNLYLSIFVGIQCLHCVGCVTGALRSLQILGFFLLDLPGLFFFAIRHALAQCIAVIK